MSSKINVVSICFIQQDKVISLKKNTINNESGPYLRVVHRPSSGGMLSRSLFARSSVDRWVNFIRRLGSTSHTWLLASNIVSRERVSYRTSGKDLNLWATEIHRVHKHRSDSPTYWTTVHVLHYLQFMTQKARRPDSSVFSQSDNNVQRFVAKTMTITYFSY